jgi:hypothetical protein
MCLRHVQRVSLLLFLGFAVLLEFVPSEVHGFSSNDVRARRTVFVVHPRRGGTHRVSLDTPPNPATTCTFRYEQVQGATPETWELLIYGDRTVGELACRARRLPAAQATELGENLDGTGIDLAAEHDYAAPSYLLFEDMQLELGDNATTVIEAVAFDSSGVRLATSDLVSSGSQLRTRSGFMGNLRSVMLKALLY